MTKDQLEQYPDICEEIRELEEESRRIVTDTVSASMGEYPYSRHTVTIRGVRPNSNAQKLEDLKQQKAEIEAFVAGLPSSGLRRIATLRALKRLPWPRVAAKMGHKYTIEQIKKKYYRLF